MSDENPRSVTISVHASDGGVVYQAGRDIVFSAAEFVAVSAASGVVGSVATVTLKKYLSDIREFFRLNSYRPQLPMVREVARLAVAARLDAETDLQVTETWRRDDHWGVTVKGGGKTYRVCIPYEDPVDRTISVDMD